MFLMEDQVTAIAKGITDWGMMAVTAAFFLVLSAGLMIACFKWFKKSLSDLLTFTSELRNLNDQFERNNRVMESIAEGLLPETQLRIKNTSGAYFDLSVEKICRLIKKIREENHIVDKKATINKIHSLVKNLHEDRNSRFDCYTYRGKKLSAYTNPEWVEWVSKVIENELYNDNGTNNNRAYTNIQSVYENIKLDFYHRINN